MATMFLLKKVFSEVGAFPSADHPGVFEKVLILKLGGSYLLGFVLG